MHPIPLIVSVMTAIGLLAMSLWCQASLGWPPVLGGFALVDAGIGVIAGVIMARVKTIPWHFGAVIIGLQFPSFLARDHVPRDDGSLAMLAVQSAGVSIYILLLTLLRNERRRA